MRGRAASRRAGLLLLALAAGPVMAQRQPPGFTFRGFLEYASPTAGASAYSTQFEAEADSGMGVGAVFESRRAPRWGVEFGLMLLNVDFDLRDASGARVTELEANVIPLMLGFDVHLLRPTARPDLYLAPLVTYTSWNSFRYEGVRTTKPDNEFGFGAVLGLDVPVSGGVQINVAVRYLTMTADDGFVEIEIDPLFFELGAGYRW